MDSPRSTPPFSLRESGDLVSAALDPPFSSVSSQSSSTSSPSAFYSLPFSSPFCTFPTSTSVSDSNTRTNRMERERSRGSLHTILTRFKRRASAFVGNGYSPSTTASSGSNSKWAAVPSTNSRTLPTSPCPYHIQDLRRSAHVAPGELEFVPFLPPVVQYERERVTASSPNYVGTSAYASSSPSFDGEYIYAHAHAASGLSFHSPHTASASSCTPSPTSSTSSCSPSSSPSASSCSTSTSSEFPPTPTSQIIPPVFEEVKPRRSSVTSDEEGESGDGEHPFLIGEPEKPPRSPPCVLSTRYRLPSPAAASLFAQPNPHPAPACALPPLPLLLQRRDVPFPPLPVEVRVVSRVEAQIGTHKEEDEPFTPNHPYALASPLLAPDLLDAFPLPPSSPPMLRSVKRSPSLYTQRSTDKSTKPKRERPYFYATVPPM